MPLILKVRTIPGGRPAHGPARSYVWRDPARCSPERLEELAAHDDYIKALERLWSKPYVSETIRKAA